MSIARPVIIDTDPGQDDAVALLLALASPEELSVLAITAVAGNVPLDLTVANSLAIVDLANRPEVPVYRGEAGPMEKTLVTAEYVHGPTGLDGAGLPAPRLSEAEGHAVDKIVEIVGRSPKPVTVCTLGPMTNVGRALRAEPGIIENIELLVFMGGGFFEGGNTTPAAEFNIYVDPCAADIVLRSGIEVVMMPLDVTHKALTTPERLERFRKLGTPAGECVAGMLGFYEQFDVEKYGTAGGPLHDPTVIAYLLEPEIFTGKNVHVEIDTREGPTEGMTIIDWWGVTANPPNAMVMSDLDADRYYDLLVERIARL